MVRFLVLALLAVFALGPRVAHADCTSAPVPCFQLIAPSSWANPQSGISGVSGDGLTVVAGVTVGDSLLDLTGYAAAWKNGNWTAMGFLAPLPNYGDTTATAVNSDGSVIVGFQANDDLNLRQAVEWSTASGQPSGLGYLTVIPCPPPNDSLNCATSFAMATSSSGADVVGWSSYGTDPGSSEAVLWSQGNITGLGFLPARTQAQPTASTPTDQL
jgi:uncharacterized membrane protein